MRCGKVRLGPRPAYRIGEVIFLSFDLAQLFDNFIQLGGGLLEPVERRCQSAQLVVVPGDRPRQLTQLLGDIRAPLRQGIERASLVTLSICDFADTPFCVISFDMVLSGSLRAFSNR